MEKNNSFERSSKHVGIPSPDRNGILFCYPANAWPQKRYSAELQEALEKLDYGYLII